MSDTGQLASGGAPSAKPRPLPRFARWLRECLSICLWLFAFVQLLVFDIAAWEIRQRPGLQVVYEFRFLLLIGFAALGWLILGNRRFLQFAGYIVAYPFLLIFWILPRILFRNWAVTVAFSPAAYSIITTFRSSFVLFSAGLISAFGVCLASDRLTIISCMSVLAVYLGVHFAKRFRVAFSPSTVFADVSGALRKTWGALQESKFWKLPENLDRDSTQYKNLFGQTLLQVYAVTTSFYAVSERLREVVNSRILDLYFLASLLYTFCLTAVLFSLEYFGLERLAPGSFVSGSTLELIDFLGLSFSTLMTSDISPLKAANRIAQMGMYLELFCSLLIVVLLVFVVLTSIRERYRQDLDGVVTELREASENFGQLFEANCEMTIVAAEQWLIEFNLTQVKWFVELRHGKELARELTSTIQPTASTANGTSNSEIEVVATEAPSQPRS